MPSLSAFNNFVKSTGEKIKTSPDEIMNDAVKNTYILTRMLKGMGASDVVQAGSKITDRIMLRDSGTAVFYNPNDDMDIQNPDTLRSVEVNWRFMANHFSYTEQEVNLNQSGDAQTYYKNLLKVKRQQAVTNSYNFMEDNLWSTPSNADMEAANGTKPYSIRSFFTVDGLAPSGFTTVETLSPTTESRWRNQFEDYDAADLTNPDTGLVNAFDNLFMKCRFISPRPGEYFQDDKFQKMMIATNRDGRALYLRLTRDSNDRLVGNDLGAQQSQLDYAGLPIEYIASLDDAGWAAGSPRFMFINLAWIHPIWHSTEYMKEKEPIRHPRQPFTWVVWNTTYYNLFCSSRRRQGVIFPTGATTV